MADMNPLLSRRQQGRPTVYEYFGQACQQPRDQSLPIRGELTEGNDGLLAQFFLDVRQGRTEAASYKCTTCVTLVAYCELLAEAVNNISLTEVMLLEPSDLIAALPGVPPYRHDRAHLAMGALHSAVSKAKKAPPVPPPNHRKE